MNPAKLKVVELRAELAARGLDTKGNKAVLVERLQEALDGESGEEGCKSTEPSTDAGNTNLDESNYQDAETTLNEPQKENEDNEIETSEEQSKPESEQNTEPPEQEKPPEETKEPDSKKPEGDSDSAAPQTQSTEEKEESASTKETITESEKMEVEVKQEMVDPEAEKSQEVQVKNEKSDAASQKKSSEDSPSNPKIKTEPSEEKATTNVKMETSIKREEGGWSESRREDRKRKRSPSPQHRGWSPTKVKEEEPELDDTAVTLSWYDSDLNLVIDKDSFLKASPMSEQGFGYIWAGARGTYGYTSGKVCYQVKLIENCDVSHLEDEPTPNVLRVGWSVLGTSLQLGEEPLSYGYGGTGKACVDCKFKNYGKSFGVGDIVSAFVEFTNYDAVLSFSVNEDYQDVAYNIPLSELKGKALVPHILTKNVKFEVNLGQLDPWVPIPQDFKWACEVDLEKRVSGPKRPEKRTECEMIMMCGLPGCGKTVWANQHSKANPDKLFNIIGTNALIDKMKVMGLPRKGNYSGRWDVLIEKCTKCLQKLMDIGCHRRRNYILDQTNVYPAAQRRKMRNFEGFIRKAVVIVPSDEEFKRRVEKRELEEGKDVPDSAVLEMKANFTLPEKSIFDEIIYTELPESEAKPLVEKYNKEGINAGYVRRGPQPGGGISGTGRDAKRFRSDYQQQRPRFDNYRRGPPMQPGGGGGSGFRRGGGGGGGSGGGPQGNRGGWQQRGPDRGWRDRNQGGGSSMGGGGGGYRASMGGGGGGGDRGMNRMGGGGGGGGWRGGGGGNSRGRNSDYGGSDRNRSGGDRSSRGSGMGGGGGRSGNQSSSYDRRDNRDSQRPKNMSGSQQHGGSMGSSGGNISSASSGGGGGGQWNQYQQHQQGGGGTQPWSSSGGGGGGGGGQQNWGQQWGNYQQPWKGGSGYNQGGGGYNQQSGYNQQGYGNQQQGYGNWQQYGSGYTPGNYSQNWPQQNWQNWYGTAQQQAGMNPQGNQQLQK